METNAKIASGILLDSKEKRKRGTDKMLCGGGGSPGTGKEHRPPGGPGQFVASSPLQKRQ